MIKNRFFTALLCVLMILPGCSRADLYRSTFFCLGTTIEINIPVYRTDLSAARKAGAACKAKVADIDRMISIFNADSAASAINNNKTKKEYKISPELYSLLKRCGEYCALTEGAFDITVEPLVEAWGFGPAGRKTPDKKAIKDIMRYVGMDKMEFRDKDNAVFFKDSRVKMDFGAIADGYAADEAIKILKRCGIKSAIVDMGGDLYCLGGNGGKKYWSIGIRNPNNKNEVLAVLNARDKAVATSGDYENFYISGGKNYAHIIDPRTGYTVDNNLRSVTIIADDCTTADALATAIFVLGEKKGLSLIDKLSGIECFLVVKDGGDLKVSMSKGMPEYLAKKWKKENARLSR